MPIMKEKIFLHENMELKISRRSKYEQSLKYFPIEHDGLKVEYSFTEGDGSSSNPYNFILEISNTQIEKWEGIFHIELNIKQKDARFFMPAFLYGRNRGEIDRHPNSRLFPRLREGQVSIPYSPYWMVRADRLSHPVSLMYADGSVYGISASPYFIKKNGSVIPWTPDEKGEFYRYNGFSCRMENGSSIGYTLGYENAPILYVDSYFIKEDKVSGQNYISLEKEEKLTVPIYIYSFKSEDERHINKVIMDVYKRFHEPPRKGALLKEGVQDISKAIYEDAYIDEIKNYSTQVYLENNSVRKNPLASISWTGGVEVATPLLMAALRLDREDMREQALKCIQSIVDSSLNEKSGLPFDAFMDGKWTTKGWWNTSLAQSGHSSYLIGQALYYILKAYDYELRLKGVQHIDWLEFSEKALMRIEKTKNQEGEYPYLWSEENGEGIEYDSFSGCWCLASLVYLAQIKKDPTAIINCIKSEEHYFNKYVKHMECYGTPHDTWKAVDSEGVLAYIKATKIFHEETNEGKFLERLKNGLQYEFTFKFCYNSPIQIPPLSKIGWSSSGGTVTSTCNPHIHPMSNNVLDELLYYCKNTGDAYFQERMKDTLYWGLQSYNRYDGEFDFGRKGWMSERFCHSEALLLEKYTDGSPASTWFCFLPWGASNVLEGMCGKLWELYV